MKNDILSLIRSLEGECACGGRHTCSVRDIVIESGAVRRVGEILKRNGFPNELLLVADRDTLAAAEGIIDSLDIVTLVTEINDRFAVSIPPEEIVPENFNSAAALWELIQRLDD